MTTPTPNLPVLCSVRESPGLMDPTMTTMFPKLDWDATVEAPLDIPQDVKTATDLPLDLGMSLPSQVPGTGALEA